MTTFRSSQLSQLVPLFRTKGLECEEAERRNDAKVQSTLSDEIREIGDAILAHGESGREALRPFLSDPSESIRLTAAARLLGPEPSTALPIVEKISREGNLQNGTFADIVLQEWRKASASAS